MPANIAFITGISGQDGSYLTQLLLSHDYVVHGIVRRSSTTQRLRLEELIANKNLYGKSLFLHYADLDDTTTIRRLLTKLNPTEFYHLAGQSHVGASFDIPESTCEFTAMGTLRILELIRDLPQPPRFLHASSSEIFGRPDVSPQDEATPMRPITPYGIAKAFATQMTSLYRDSFQLFACNAICYNHESPRRGESFVTRKITRAAAAIAAGQQDFLYLGNIETKRDWGFAPDYVQGMWKMLQHETADDYILATGYSCSLAEFLEAAFNAVDLKWQDYVKVDPKFYRPADAVNLVGNPAKAVAILGWKPSVTLSELVGKMVDHDQEVLRNSAHQ